MRLLAKIQELNSAENMHIIIGDLSRILDVLILGIDFNSRTVSLIYDSILVFENTQDA
jgi:hypothetical protein